MISEDDLRTTRQLRAGIEGAGFLAPADLDAVRDLAAMVLATQDDVIPAAGPPRGVPLSRADFARLVTAA